MQPLPLPDRIVPVLAPFARISNDALTHNPILLYPEGILELEETAASTLALCDGQRSLDQIVQTLADRYEAPDGEIAADVHGYLAELVGKGLVRWKIAP